MENFMPKSKKVSTKNRKNVKSKISSKSKTMSPNKKLDEALEETFPASDPTATY